MRTLIVHLRRRRASRSLLALACVAALAVAAVPAVASPIGGYVRHADTPNPRATTSPPVIHELHTVIRERDAGRTLSIVLAGVALFVAGGAAAYSVVGVRRRGLSAQS